MLTNKWIPTDFQMNLIFAPLLLIGQYNDVTMKTNQNPPSPFQNHPFSCQIPSVTFCIDSKQSLCCLKICERMIMAYDPGQNFKFIIQIYNLGAWVLQLTVLRFSFLVPVDERLSLAFCRRKRKKNLARLVGKSKLNSKFYTLPLNFALLENVFKLVVSLLRLNSSIWPCLLCVFNSLHETGL